MGDWPTVRVKDIAQRVAMGPFGSNIKADNFVKAGVPVIRGGNISDVRLNLSDIVFLTEHKADELKSSIAVPGDLVFTHRGTLGQIGLIPDSPFPRYVVSQSQMLLSCDRSKAIPEFIFYFFRSPVGQERLLANRSQVGVPSIARPTNALKSIEIELPSLAEQKRIADVLTALDDKIELNRLAIATVEELAQAIFRDWFVDFGPVSRRREGAVDPVAILGNLIPDPERAAHIVDCFPTAFNNNGLPLGWSQQSLLDQAHWINGAAYKNMHFVNRTDGLPVVKIAELKAGVTTSTKFTNTDLGDRYRIDTGELLFSWSGNPDTSINAFVWVGGPSWLNQHIFAVRGNGCRTKAELYVLLKFLMPQMAEIARDKQTTGLGHVTKEDMRRMMVIVPSARVKDAFTGLVTPIFDRVIAALTENRDLAETRDYLLPRLMSGRLRVADAERVAG